MKQGWEIKKIGDICDIKTGKLDANASSENGQYPFFTCSVEPLKIDYYAYDCECVLIAGNGDLNVKYYNGKFNAYQRTYIITTKTEVKNICVKYLYKFFSAYIEQLRKLSIGSVIKYIKLGNLTDAVILIPSLEEQERIVEVLDREFEKIDALKANAEQNLQHAKDLFQAALRKELQPKEGWVVSTLQTLLKLTSGDNLTAKSIINGEYPVYGGNGIMGYHNQYNLDGHNVIVGRVGALCGNVRLVEGKIWFTDNAFLVHDKNKLFHLPYLTYELQRADLRQYATQTAQPVVSNASMKDVILSAPPTISEQKQIVARLDKLKEYCIALEDNYKKTIALCDDMKHALLRKAFNGEL